VRERGGGEGGGGEGCVGGVWITHTNTHAHTRTHTHTHTHIAPQAAYSMRAPPGMESAVAHRGKTGAKQAFFVFDIIMYT
jgi:hypothetical protein